MESEDFEVKFGQKLFYWAIFALIALFGVIYITQASQYFIPLGNDGVIYHWPVGMFMAQASPKDFFIASISSFMGEDHLSPVSYLYGYICYILASDPSSILNVTTKLTHLFVVISSLLVVNRLWKDNLRLLVFFLLLTFNLSLTWRSMISPGHSLSIIAPLWCLFFIDRYLKDKKISDIILFSISFLILTFSFEYAFVGIPLVVFYVLLFIWDTQTTNFAKAKEFFKICSIMFISFLPYLIIHYWLYGTLMPKSRASVLEGNSLINYSKMIALLLSEWSFGVGKILFGDTPVSKIAIIITVISPVVAFIAYSIYKYRLLSRTGFYLFVAFIAQFLAVLYTGRVESGMWLLVGIVFCIICADIILEVINKHFKDNGLYAVRKAVYIVVLILIPSFVFLNGVVQPFNQAEKHYRLPYESSQAAYKAIAESADRLVTIRLSGAEELMHPMAFWLGNKIYNNDISLWVYPKYYQLLFKNMNIEYYNNEDSKPFSYYRPYLTPNPDNKEVIVVKDRNTFSRIFLDSKDSRILRTAIIPYAEQKYYKIRFPDLSAYDEKIKELKFILTLSGNPKDVEEIMYGGKPVKKVHVDNNKISFISDNMALENDLVVNVASSKTRLLLIEVVIHQSDPISNKARTSVKSGLVLKTQDVPCRYEMKSPDGEVGMYGTLDANREIAFTPVLKKPLTLVYKTFETNRNKQMKGKIDLNYSSQKNVPIVLPQTEMEFLLLK